MEQLKRCPFCGGEAKIDKTTSNAVEVACSECSASTPLFWAFIGGKEKAIEAWNTRKPTERILERLEEPNNYTIMCGKHFTTVERVIEIVKEEMEE